jgi:hypothetical protein
MADTTHQIFSVRNAIQIRAQRPLIQEDKRKDRDANKLYSRA